MTSHPHLAWRKSTYSGSNANECVELADADGRVAARDSKHPDGTILTITRGGWNELLRGIKNA
ncbi:DUF397 domain-containing protein [Actinocorallia longicatena]|uniref:DUF397 domain-containing protein n=1 Tax=Actinocorallia longicatena TaxID=111803 RepID=A0ABP6QH42_9ACTN